MKGMENNYNCHERINPSTNFFNFLLKDGKEGCMKTKDTVFVQLKKMKIGI